ncbi:MAG: winged helix-turn-helix transcriptional regulator [Thermoplasmatales archaeon]|nr:MAG: winged helix-turn-helix transcriptional regulator [Thermoplasmatales archaeon]
MNRKYILELENKRKIYNFVLNHPGSHLREISRTTGIAYGTVDYHLRHLEKQEIINSVSYKFYKRYYIKYKHSTIDKKIINILREPTPKKIIIFLLSNTCGTREELSNELEKTPQTISYHIKSLLDSDIIEHAITCDKGIYLPKNQFIFERHPAGSEILYKIKDPKIIYYSLLKYPGCLSDIPDIDIIFHYFDYIFSKKIQKRILNNETFFDKTLDNLFTMFPHPYHA